jgi:hypothetical protein
MRPYLPQSVCGQKCVKDIRFTFLSLFTIVCCATNGISGIHHQWSTKQVAMVEYLVPNPPHLNPLLVLEMSSKLKATWTCMCLKSRCQVAKASFLTTMGSLGEFLMAPTCENWCWASSRRARNYGILTWDRWLSAPKNQEGNGPHQATYHVRLLWLLLSLRLKSIGWHCWWGEARPTLTHNCQTCSICVAF